VSTDERYLDRELSWLAFNERVLQLAEDESMPLLERVKFLAIFSSNLDEFFMVRVAGLQRRIAAGIAIRATSGLLPRTAMDLALRESRVLMERQSAIFSKQVLPQLRDEGIDIVHWSDLSVEEKANLQKVFNKKLFPVLTPLAVDPSHPFPYISGLSLNLAVTGQKPNGEESFFARVKVPPSLPRLLPADGTRFVPLEEVISAHLDQLFPGMAITSHHTFRVTRNEDVEVEEDEAESLLDALEKELTRRRFGPPVRLEVEDGIDEEVLDTLIEELGITDNEVIRVSSMLDMTGLMQVYELPREDLKLPSFQPRTSPEISDVETSSPSDVLDAIRKHDVLVHHPYDAFSTSVQRFIEQAANDPQVLAIKQTLYRTSGDSPVLESLIEAAENGKQVLVIVEIKARFDEQTNITWARKLEQAGVHVVYGLVGLKTHAKLAMVIRQEGEQVKRYCHIGTGNYHPRTARTYEDLGLLTCDEAIGDDLARLFNELSGFGTEAAFNRLMVAPRALRSTILEKIEQEIENHKRGLPSGIRFKCNALIDEQIIDALYEASNAGVKVDLVIRGMCSLRPGTPGLSENIRVRSILGRFLEHSRIYHFANGGEDELWLGSADMMHRNLDRRVETLVSIKDQGHIDYLKGVLDLALASDTAAWHLRSDGTWENRDRDENGLPLQQYQETLLKRKGLRGSA